MDLSRIREIREDFARRMALAEMRGDEKELMLLDMEMEDSMILKHGRVSGIVDEEDLF
ncbi:hypothetical protein ABG79_02154 [Caloramator mitchellensis]|uniref:Uncharacterized protein n=1 Tax=Caloramator mitchellensis TaxID=908809 RepID=A0A0R3JRD3_CALMK|nr:hypothetical protein [Caloramator mitchellensis]KRQ86022.1 hypothetical protein ABG79_02154 [Caloramator mitchellensis]